MRCWLDAHDVGVAEKAARVLGDVLETDCPAVVQPAAIQAQQLNGDSNNGNELVPRPRQPGHGRLWSLLLEHRPMASLIPHYATPGGDGDRSLRQVSLSQGRVLRLVPRLASLNMTAVASSRLSDIFAVDGDEAPGLLPWAALQMVDRGDALMHLNLIDFFETLVSVMRVSPNRTHAVDTRLAALVKAAVATDDELAAALRSLPDRTVEEEAEPLRDYIKMLLG